MANNNYCVYKHTSPEGKVYIGITSKDNPEHRWGRDGLYYRQNVQFYKDIERFGWDNFKREIVAKNLTKIEATEIEHGLIKATQSTDPRYGYNHNESGVDSNRYTSNNNNPIIVVGPNSKIITICKQEDSNNCLHLNNLDWQAACAQLTYTAFKIYLYMSSYNDGHMFTLNYNDINKIMPMGRGTYDNAIKDLKKHGYLKQISGSSWNFYTSENQQ